MPAWIGEINMGSLNQGILYLGPEKAKQGFSLSHCAGQKYNPPSPALFQYLNNRSVYAIFTS